MTDYRQRTCKLVLQPHEEHRVEGIHGGDTPSVEARHTRGQRRRHALEPVHWREEVQEDLLVGAPVGHWQELVVWEGVPLVTTIGMLERFLDLCRSLGPDFWCLWWPEKHVFRGKKDIVSSEPSIVESGEDGGYGKSDEDVAKSDTTVLVETERGDEVDGGDVAEERRHGLRRLGSQRDDYYYVRLATDQQQDLDYGFSSFPSLSI